MHIHIWYKSRLKPHEEISPNKKAAGPLEYIYMYTQDRQTQTITEWSIFMKQSALTKQNTRIQKAIIPKDTENHKVDKKLYIYGFHVYML